jgi:hypothetical protein
MEKIFSSIDQDKLLHFIHRRGDFGERTELIETSEFLQLSSQIIERGRSFRAHRHIPKRVYVSEITAQESWVVISGQVEVSYFDLDDSLIKAFMLFPGDVSVTLAGGHSYEIVDDALVYEFKTGPYLGVEFDKQFI